MKENKWIRLLGYVTGVVNQELLAQNDTPNRRAVEQRPGPSAPVTSMPRLGGLHHRYTWRQAA